MSWLKKTVLSVKKAKDWKKKIIIEDWCFCYNGLQRFSTLHRLRLQHVLPVGVSGIISMLNLCDINEKFPNSNTWVHLSSIWLGFFFSQSSFLSPLILLACRCNMEQKFDLFSQNCFNFVEMITCQGRRNVKEFGEDKLIKTGNLKSTQNYKLGILWPFLVNILLTTLITFTKLRFRRSFWGA